MTKHIFVCGGVMSGIGKGITSASIAKILKSYGYSVSNIKIDPYLNVDAGTMNPIEHGEVFVTDDGLESDQDLGNYERFLDQNMYRYNYMTAGQIFMSVIQRERNLGYKGKCVEFVPHLSDEIIDRIKKAEKETKADFIITEIGGTVGEIQNALFLEAARQMHLRNEKNVLFVLVSYLPVPKKLGEMKTKPTQYSVKTLNSVGIQPDFIIGRSESAVDDIRKRKISIACSMDERDIISAPDIDSIYRVPVNFEKDNIGKRILSKLGLKPRKRDFSKWEKLVERIEAEKKNVNVGIVGKYFESGGFTLMDSYISVIEAIKHAGWANNVNPKIQWLNAESYEKNKNNLKEIKKFDCIVVPGGFGKRGIEGKIRAIQYCRENKIPILGLCLGMQLASVEFARNVCGIKNANSAEMTENKNEIIHIMEGQKKKLKEKDMGGSMRLGAYDCKLKKGTKAYSLYKKELISERHRHRYEFNNEYKELMEKKGLVFSGINPKKNLVEIIEIKNHPFFIASQFHPELKSRPENPHPLFVGLIKAGIKK